MMKRFLLLATLLPRFAFAQSSGGLPVNPANPTPASIGALSASSNLSDVAAPATARVNLGAFPTFGYSSNTLSAPVSSVAPGTSPGVIFTGDLSHTIAHQHTISGANTLGVPSGGNYVQILEASGYLDEINNTSGYNLDLTKNNNRTGAADHVAFLHQNGQGDLTGWFCFGYIGSTLTGQTGALAGPEAGCMAANIVAGGNGQYIEPIGDLDASDKGFDISVANVFNFNRTNGAEALGQFWDGLLLQSIGTTPIDAFLRGTGVGILGVDLSSANLSFYRIASDAVNAGGSGYVIGDVLTATGGTLAPGAAATQFKLVGSMTGGVITTANLSVVQTGMYTTPPVTPGTFGTIALSGGTGTGAIIKGQYLSNLWALLPQAGGCSMVSGGTSPAATNLVGLNSAVCQYPSGTTIGGVNNTLPSAAGANSVQIGNGHLGTGKGNVQLGAGTYDTGLINGLYFQSVQVGTVGSSQMQTFTFVGSASSTSAVTLTADNSGTINANNSLSSTPTLTLRGVPWKCYGIDTVNGDWAAWDGSTTTGHKGILVRATGNAAYSGDASTATAPDHSSGAGSSASLIVGANTTFNSLSVAATPPTSNAHKWVFMFTVEGGAQLHN